MSMRRMFTCWLTVWCVLGSLAWAEEAPVEITCSGKVVNDANEPIAGVKVMLYHWATSMLSTVPEKATIEEKTTGADGTFAFTAEAVTPTSKVPRRGIVVARKEGYSIGWDNWSLKRNLDSKMVMTSPMMLSGCVVDDSDKPLSGAEVSLGYISVGGTQRQHYIKSIGPVGQLMARTDSNGVFRFEAMPGDTMTDFLVRMPGRATVSTYKPSATPGQFVPGQAGIRIALPPEAKIEGKVVEKATGKGLDGVMLTCTDEAGASLAGVKTVVSHGGGIFSLDTLEGRDYFVTIVPPRQGHAPGVGRPVKVTTEAGRTASGVMVELIEGGILEVKVTDADKKPLAGATVVIGSGDGQESQVATSDANGIATARVFPGEYTSLIVYKTGYLSTRSEESLKIESGKTVSLDMKMKGSPKISGVVRDAAGKPVAGAEIQTIPFGGGMLKSDPVGAFEMQWDPQRWSDQQVNSILVARHIERNLAAVVDIDEDTRKLEVTVSGGITLAGKVVDAESKPVAGADVSVILHTSNYGSGLGSSQVRTDKNGRYEYKAIPGDMTYSVQASADGYGEDSTDLEVSDAVDSRVDIEPLTLKKATMSVSGIVVDANDKPVPGARVYINGDGQQYRQGKSDAKGRFTIDKLCQGRIQVSAQLDQADRMYGNASAEAGDTDIKVTLLRPGSDGRQTSRVARRPASLLAKPLADLTQFGLTIDPNAVKDKPILLCFVDLNQRPSRHCLNELAAGYGKLVETGVFVAGVRFGDGGANVKQAFPLGQAAEFEKISLAWGVKALPWLVLTDSRHIVVAEGFSTSEIDEKVKALQKRQK